MKIFLFFVSLVAILEIISAPIEWLWPEKLGGFTYWSGSTNRREVAITFDDGPSKYTARILDILKDQKVPATFFVMGQQAELFPEVIVRMAAENHEIGNHTYSFEARFFKLFSNIQESQIERCQQIIEDLVDIRPKYFRSPGGQLGRHFWNYIRKHNLKVVNGSLPIPPPEKDSDTQLEVIKSTLRPGAILILHDGDDGNPASDRPLSTVELLPKLFLELEQRGYQIVPLVQILTGA